jgi:hypothetical protein
MMTPLKAAKKPSYPFHLLVSLRDIKKKIMVWRCRWFEGIQKGLPGEGLQDGGLARVVQPQQEDSQFSVLGGLQLPEVEFINS